MNFTKRQEHILRKCVKHHFSYNIDTLSIELRVSKKTIQNDIKYLNDAIALFDSNIYYENNKVYLKTIYPPLHWLNIIELNKKINDVDFIILILLCLDNVITINELADLCFMSKSKVEKLLSNSELNNSTLSKTRNHGIYINLNVAHKIVLFSEIMLKYVDPLNYLVTSRQLLKQVVQQDLTIEQFNDAVKEFDIIVLNNKIISDLAIRKLFLQVLFCTTLSIGLDNIKLDFPSQNTISKDTIRKLAIDVFEFHNLEFQNTMDFKLMVNHLYNLTTSKNNYILEEQYKKEIANNFSYSYNISMQILVKLEQLVNMDFFECEKYILAIYVQTILDLETEATNYNILIICQYGMSVSNYIAATIRNNVSLNLQIDTASIYKFQKEMPIQNKYDLIVSTIDNLESSEQNIFYISMIPSQSELIELTNYIENKMSLSSIRQLFQNNMTINAENINSHSELIQCLKNTLINTNFVHDEFFTSLENRVENLIPVKATMIYHADAKFVKHSQILTVFKPNIENLKIIFVFMFSTKFIKDNSLLIRKIHNLLLSEEYNSSIVSARNLNQIKWIFENEAR